ncbi:MAG: nucleotide sugar dehydrogenase [Chthoniobacteraceae bacterium]
MNPPLQSVSVFGLGKLGACIAASLAKRGFDVVGIDIDPEKVARVNAGEPPLDEPLLAETIAEGGARLKASLDPKDALATQATFFIPPTPSLPDGSFTSEYLLKAMQPLARVIRQAGKRDHLFVCSSTTTPGAMGSILIPMLERETGWKLNDGFRVCYNPEFIALGDVIRGLLAPDMVLIGESDAVAGDLLEDLYRRYNTNEPHIARMSIASAELTKISVNSYITMKISFTNQLRLMADRLPGTNIHDILDAIGSDSRIGRKYLKAGVSYGGPCFPRDNRLVAYTARQAGLKAPLAEASDMVNELTKDDLVREIIDAVPASATVAVLGLSYKPQTYITEESAGLHLAQKLKRAGYRVLVHDGAATPANSPALHEFEQLGELASLGERGEITAAAICCPWPEYQSVKFHPTTRVLSHWRM